MKIQYENEFVQSLGMGYPTTCVYQLVYVDNGNYYTNIIHIFYYEWTGIMHQGS